MKISKFAVAHAIGALFLAHSALATEVTALATIGCRNLMGFMPPNDTELRQSMEIKIALAEFMHAANKDIEPASKKLFDQVLSGDLDPVSSRQLAPYQELFKSMVEDSPAIRRLSGEEQYLEMGGGQLSLGDVIIRKKNSRFLPQPTLWQRFIGLFASKPPINFELASNFYNDIRAVSEGQRLKVLKKSLRGIPSLTLPEVFYIASAFEAGKQVEALKILSEKLATPPSVFSLETMIAISSSLAPEARTSFFHDHNYSISKEDFNRLLNENPDLLQEAKEAQIRMTGFALSQNEQLDLLFSAPEKLQKAREYGATLEELTPHSLETLFKRMSATSGPLSSELINTTLTIIEGISGKQNKLSAAKRLAKLMDRMSDSLKLKLNNFIAATEVQPEISVDEIIRTAENSYEGGSDIISDYYEKHKNVLTVDEVIKLAERTYETEDRDEILSNYVETQASKLKTSEVIEIAGSAYESVDSILISYAEARAEDLDVDSINRLAEAVNDYDNRDVILEIIKQRH